jgi:hypothetical protein
MPHIKTLFRSPPLSTPAINYYDWLLGRPELNSWLDFTLHIDAGTGEQSKARAVLERFEQAAAATVLATSPRDGGLGLGSERQEVVGIISENCLVRAESLSVVHLTHDGTLFRNTQFSCCPSQVSCTDGVPSFSVHSSRNRGTVEAFLYYTLIREREVVPSRRSGGSDFGNALDDCVSTIHTARV